MMLTRLLFAPVIGATILGSWGCASRDAQDGDEGTDQGKWVQEKTFSKMADIIKTVNYLPFRYKADGCYARALYMSMELAAEGLESNAIFAFAQPGAPLVVGPITWRYHVTPLLNVGPDAEHLTPMVFDPAIAPEPMTRQKWVELMGHPADSARPPKLMLVPGSDYGPGDAYGETQWLDRDLPDFDHLPAFSTRDVQDACNVMFRYLSREPAKTPAAPAPASTPEAEEEETVLDPVAQNSPLTAAEKQALLVSRTETLIGKLTERKKLTADVTFSATRCQGL